MSRKNRLRKFKKRGRKISSRSRKTFNKGGSKVLKSGKKVSSGAIKFGMKGFKGVTGLLSSPLMLIGVLAVGGVVASKVL